MNVNNRSSFLTYAVIALLLINIVVIGLLLFQRFNHHKGPECCPPGGKDEKKQCMTDFLEKELKFSKEQVVQFQELKSKFHPVAKLYFDSLETLESGFFTEISKPNPDSVVLHGYVSDFSRLQFELKQQTLQHLLKIKSICNPEQQVKYFEHIMKNRHCRDGMPLRPQKRHECADSNN